MNFFEHQAKARQKTGLLVFLFVLAVALILLAVNASVLMAMGWYFQTNHPHSEVPYAGILAWTTFLTMSVIVLGTIKRIADLRGGGMAVASMMNAKFINPETKDEKQRRFLNVVEEMSIASGCKIPPAFVMENERGINAFAAGYEPSGAIVCVSQGCLDNLTRDELQAVVAHEFSHIFNGDMRLNIRLLGILNGILILGLIGMGVLRGMRWSSSGSSRSSRSDTESKGGGGGIVVLLAIAMALTIIGYIGVFFGRLIKCAVSREREYLADASAVQFTRNPGALTDVFKKLLAHGSGSKIYARDTEHLSHFFFADALQNSILLKTHPSLEDRIKRVEPSFDAKRFDPDDHKLTPKEVVENIGKPKKASLDFARMAQTILPALLDDFLATPVGVETALYAMLLSDNKEIQKIQWENILQGTGQDWDTLSKLSHDMRAERIELRLPMLTKLLPSLDSIPAEKKTEVLKVVRELIHADNYVSIFEYLLETLVEQQIHPKKAKPKLIPVQPTGEELSGILSLMAWSGAEKEADARDAFLKGAELAGVPTFLSWEEITKIEIPVLFNRLGQSSPRRKQRIVAACAATAAGDGVIDGHEAEVLRAVCLALDCPLPPLSA